MEMKLERMRKEVRGRMWQTLVITVVMAALLIVVCSGVIAMRSGDQRAADFLQVPRWDLCRRPLWWKCINRRL